MKYDKPVFVAETDETGRVVWVWYLDPGTPKPAPVRNPTANLAILEKSVVSGASRAEIAGWLARHGDRAC